MALDDLYREVILDHYTHPRNKGSLDGADIKVDGANPLCGDELSIYVKLAAGLISDVRFVGRGCSISQASPSLTNMWTSSRITSQAPTLVERREGKMRGEHVPEE